MIPEAPQDHAGGMFCFSLMKYIGCSGGIRCPTVVTNTDTHTHSDQHPASNYDRTPKTYEKQHRKRSKSIHCDNFLPTNPQANEMAMGKPDSDRYKEVGQIVPGRHVHFSNEVYTFQTYHKSKYSRGDSNAHSQPSINKQNVSKELKRLDRELFPDGNCICSTLLKPGVTRGCHLGWRCEWPLKNE